MNIPQKNSNNRWWWSKTGVALLAFLAIAAFFLITEHTAHFFGFLPYALLLLCPLLHLYMHSGHGDHSAPGGHTNHQAPEERQ